MLDPCLDPEPHLDTLGRGKRSCMADLSKAIEPETLVRDVMHDFPVLKKGLAIGGDEDLAEEPPAADIDQVAAERSLRAIFSGHGDPQIGVCSKKLSLIGAVVRHEDQCRQTKGDAVQEGTD